MTWGVSKTGYAWLEIHLLEQERCSGGGKSRENVRGERKQKSKGRGESGGKKVGEKWTARGLNPQCLCPRLSHSYSYNLIPYT